jgi:hypothetical protein
MTKKHLQALADALWKTKPAGRTDYHMEQWKADVNAVAAVCARYNDKFDILRFLSACGFTEAYKQDLTKYYRA